MNIIYKNLIILILIIFYNINARFDFSNNNKKIIFTFWEPKEKMPGFLKLCIKTWKKNLPDYKIIILDYKQAKYYIGENLFSKLICNNMSRMVQSDAIRVAILNKFGGIWMDADTIILNDEIIKYFQNYNFAMIWEEKLLLHYISFIYSSKNCSIINKWQEKIIDRVQHFKNILLNKENTTHWINSWKDVNTWYYLGNGIIDFLVSQATDEKFFHIDSDKTNVFPEFKLFKNSTMQPFELYNYFYFQNRDPQIVLNITKSLIFLHNSWTPIKYKNMTEKEFLNQDILLSKLLAKILELKD